MAAWVEIQVEICSVVFCVLAGSEGLRGRCCCVLCVVSAAIRSAAVICLVGV
jgi:hypothetical protein